MTAKQTQSADAAGSSLREALKLVHGQRTMVLATCDQTEPWSAPVYFVYTSAGFCFFSSPRSEHVRHIEAGSGAAVSIFSDSGEWRLIRGLQMRGTVCRLGKIEGLGVAGRFILKFPFARDFLQGPGAAPDLSRKVRLYAFKPQEIYLVDNSTEFGRRVALDPHRVASAALKES